MTLRAVIFDCDGVLVDSEPLGHSIWGEVTRRYGYEITAEDSETCRGHNDRYTYDLLAERAELPPWELFMEEIVEVEELRYPGELAAFPDAFEAVRALAAQGLPLAVGSSSPRRRVELSLTLTDLARYFDVVVAGDDVLGGADLAGKPAPDIYLAAAAGLGVDPAQCIAIEDSEAGSAAAVAAGMRVIAVARPGAPPVEGSATVNVIDAELILMWLGLR